MGPEPTDIYALLPMLARFVLSGSLEGLLYLGWL
jgi:hypothetical protein